MFSVETQLDNATSILDCERRCGEQENYVCRAYRFDEATHQCLLSSDDRASSRANSDQNSQSFFGFMERGECVDSKCYDVRLNAVD